MQEAPKERRSYTLIWMAQSFLSRKSFYNFCAPVSRALVNRCWYPEQWFVYQGDMASWATVKTSSFYGACARAIPFVSATASRYEAAVRLSRTLQVFKTGHSCLKAMYRKWGLWSAVKFKLVQSFAQGGEASAQRRSKIIGGDDWWLQDRTMIYDDNGILPDAALSAVITSSEYTYATEQYIINGRQYYFRIMQCRCTVSWY